MSEVSNKNFLKKYCSPLTQKVVFKKILKGSELCLESKNDYEKKNGNYFIKQEFFSTPVSSAKRHGKQKLHGSFHGDAFFIQPAQPLPQKNSNCSSSNSVYFDSSNQSVLFSKKKFFQVYNNPSFFSKRFYESGEKLSFENSHSSKSPILLNARQLQALSRFENEYSDMISSQIFFTPQNFPATFPSSSSHKSYALISRPKHFEQSHQSIKLLNKEISFSKPLKHFSSPTVPTKSQISLSNELLQNSLDIESFSLDTLSKPTQISHLPLEPACIQCSSVASYSQSFSTYTSLPDFPKDFDNHSTPNARMNFNFEHSFSYPIPIDTRLRMNVSGQYFDVKLTVLEKHPETLLGDENARNVYYDKKRHEYFFDRHRPSFEVIFSYYLHGKKIKRPTFIPEDIFLEELKFFKIEKDIIKDYKKQEGYCSDEEEEHVENSSGLKKVVWDLFEQPKSSRSALTIALTSVTMTIIAIILLCVETLPYFKKTSCDHSTIQDPFFMLETICNMWFTVEVIIRIFSCPSKMTYIKDFKNIIDILSVVPFYFTIFTILVTTKCLYTSQNTSDALAFLRVIRLVRIFKLTKHSIGLQVLVMTFKESVEGLGIFLATLIVCMLFYSSALYYAEATYPGSQIHSIPDAFWWAIITMTTVGYGDKVPVGPLGRLIGAACAISGILTLAIPVPIIAGHFNKFYTHKTGRARYQHTIN